MLKSELVTFSETITLIDDFTHFRSKPQPEPGSVYGQSIHIGSQSLLREGIDQQGGSVGSKRQMSRWQRSTEPDGVRRCGPTTSYQGVHSYHQATQQTNVSYHHLVLQV